MSKAPPMPTLTPATTVEGALADLAGAVQIAVELLIEENGTSDYGFILIVALRQWQNSGFVAREAQVVAETIAHAIIATKH